MQEEFDAEAFVGECRESLMLRHFVGEYREYREKLMLRACCWGV